jgi:starvation-inducible DNA-binding protein
MDQLAEALKVLLGTVYSLSVKAQNYHWNVTGPNFVQYHEYFGDFYDEVGGSIDSIAELIRVVGSFAPGSLTRFKELSRVEDELMIPEPALMFARLARDNDVVIATLYEVRSIAEQLGQNGVVNFIEDRITIHEKHRWMLRSFS